MTMSSDQSFPQGSWDSHVHIEMFPLHPSHPYRPRKADLHDLMKFEAEHGISHVCLIAFSVYHDDNSAIAWALEKLNGRGRAVVCINPSTVTDEELDWLHNLGARGVRINLRTRSQQMDQKDFQRLLERYADRIRSRGWAIQLYVALAQIEQIASVITGLGVPVVIDHIGAPDSNGGRIQDQPGYKAYMDLLESGLVWTKLSGVYRFDELPGLDEYVIQILRTAPDRVVWASDWPHSGGPEANPNGDRHALQDYRQVDDHGWIARCKRWCEMADERGVETLIRKIWRDNPRTLWQFDTQKSQEGGGSTSHF
ncbi:hypothetical protein B0I35DRAFT_363796 [Stachybotrys elegans]|uniref:Amidohydrolase-related domain-containing protein n=1 Tax=Stachybotrys elegans TaxID=80388 RepID=A0A8K0WL45_9HYPO|nr:hypothetical protein B0I35DRAFT_363796 [Stachybotrys elegans]